MRRGATGRWWRAMLMPFGLLVLISCAGAEQPRPAAYDDGTSRLFARAYYEVMEFYITPVSAKEAAFGALRRLSSFDPAITVTEDGDDLLLRDHDRTLDRFALADAHDARAWGAITAAVVQSAKAQSPEIANVSEDRLERALFAGLTGMLDRFSRYSSPHAARAEHASREGFEGVGITLDYDDAEVRVTSVVADSPADRAGIRFDDRIVAIDGTPTASMARDDIVSRLRGPAGSTLVMTLRRAGATELLRRSLTRAYIIVPTVTARRDGGLAIFRISSFNEHTTDALRDDFQRLRKEAHGSLRGIVLDLRDDPGGLLDQAVTVAALFMPSGRVVSTIGRNPESMQEFEARHGDMAGGMPMAVLVNGGSASSAEIVAAALQDSGRAIVVGSTSYGKGTVQMVLRLPNEGELILTWAKLFTPAGYALHEHGVVPTVCTSGAADGSAAALAAILKRSAAFDANAQRPRATLGDAEWSELRSTCPGERQDHLIELLVAERLLESPAVFARLLHVERPAIAAGIEAAPHTVQ